MARDASTQPDLTRLEQLSPMESQIGSPPFQVYPSSPNPLLRSPLAPTQWLQPDTLRQFYRLGTPQNRIAPLQANATATINSTAKGVATTVVEQFTGSTVALQVNGTPNADQNLLNLENGTGVTIKDNGSGNVSISAGGSGLPLPNSGVFFLARAIVGQTALQTLGDSSTAVQNGGTVSISNGAFPSPGIGVNIAFTVGSGGGGAFNGWFPINSSNNANGIFTAGLNCRYQARIVTQSLVDVVQFLGFSTGTPSTMRTLPFSANDFVGVYSPGIGFTDHWQATINGGTTVDTGVLIPTGVSVVDIIMDDTANTTSFSVNGSAPVVISGMNISGVNWFPTATFAVNASVTIGFNLEYFYGQQDY